MQHIPFFLASDNNYAPFVATTIASTCDHTKSFVDFYILDGGITTDNQNKIAELKKKFSNFSLEFIKVDVAKEFGGIDYSNALSYISLSTYNRFLIPDLKPDIERALYSDVDVIVLGDIAEMYNEDMHGYALGAVWEEYLENSRNKERKTRLGLGRGHKYFSAGNLLVDCKQWRQRSVFKQLFGIATSGRYNLKSQDMDVLNIFFDCNYSVLSPKYCWLNRYYDFYGENNEIIIRHFEGPFKPWLIHPYLEENPNLPWLLGKNYFWHYLELTSFYDEVFAKIQYNNKHDLSKYLVFELLRKHKQG